MKDLYGLLVLNPVTQKLWLSKAWHVKLTDADVAAKTIAKRLNTKVYLVRIVEVING